MNDPEVRRRFIRHTLFAIIACVVVATGCVPEPVDAAPGAPQVSASAIGGGGVRLSWTAPASGTPVTMEIAIDGGAWQAAALSGTVDVNTGYNAVHSISARATAGGVTGPTAVASATSGSAPIVVSKYRGPANPTTSGTCPAGRCSIVGAALAGFAPTTTHTVNCSFGPANGIPDVTATVDGAGSWTGLTKCFAGNTTVGIIVDGVAYDVGSVSWYV